MANCTYYQPFRSGRKGHWDDWEPDDPEECEFELLTMRGIKNPRLYKLATEADLERIEIELIEAIQSHKAESFNEPDGD